MTAGASPSLTSVAAAGQVGTPALPRGTLVAEQMAGTEGTRGTVRNVVVLVVLALVAIGAVVAVGLALLAGLWLRRRRV